MRRAHSLLDQNTLVSIGQFLISSLFSPFTLLTYLMVRAFRVAVSRLCGSLIMVCAEWKAPEGMNCQSTLHMA